MRRLMAYDWPGNVRELENAVERAVALGSGPILHVGDLPSNLQYKADEKPLEVDELLPSKISSAAPSFAPCRKRAEISSLQPASWALARPPCTAN